MHDCTEAYLGDIAAPIKRRLPDYMHLEKKLHEFLSKQFGYRLCVNDVGLTHMNALKMEWEYLMLGKRIPKNAHPMYDEFIELRLMNKWEIEVEFVSTYCKLFKAIPVSHTGKN